VMPIPLEIYLVPGELTTGLWCPHCLKPSGYEQLYYSLWSTGVSYGGIRLRLCYDCGARIPQEDPQL
jgi:hypothetical protein